MTATYGAARCNNCDAVLPVQFCQPMRIPCPHCGSTGRNFGVRVEMTAAALPVFKVLALRAGMSRTKGWFVRIFEGLVPQLSRSGLLARVERRFERDLDAIGTAKP